MILTSTMNTTTTTTTSSSTTTDTTTTTSTTSHNYVNISGLHPINDPYFRYKMPLPHILQNSTLNKTILSNLSDLVSTLHSCRSKPCPEEVMKFLSLDLATRTHCDYNSSSSSSCLPEQGLVCGNFTKLQVQNSINKYIEFFILCPRCRCPETQYRKKKGRIFLDCVGGCGALEEVEIDNHCFCRYILSHCANEFVVEEEEEEDENGRKKRGSGGRRGKSHKRKHHHHHHRHSGTQKSKERHHHVDNNNNNNNNDEAVENELLDVTTTVESSSEDEIETASDATAAAADQQQQEDAIENLQSFLQRYPNASTEDILNILQTTTTSSSSEEEEEEEPTTQTSSCRQQIQILIQAAFQNNTNTNTYCRQQQQQQQSLFHHTNQSIQRLTPVLSSLTNSVPSLERCLISALEVLLSTQPPPPPPPPPQEQTQTCTITSSSSSSSFSSIPKSFFPVMLKQLYEQDVLKEDVILSWASQEERSEEYTEDCVDEVSRCELRRYAEEFVVWLREAEEESSTEEESRCEEEEEEEEECAAPSTTTTTTTTSCSPVRSSIFGNISWCDTSLEDTDDDYLLQNNDDDNNNNNNNSSRRRRRVHFSTMEVSGIREIPRIQNMDEWSSCFYTGHEMQRMADDARREQQQQQQQQQQLQVGF